MPVFEFECKTKGHRFEVLIRSKGELKNIRCPECGSVKVYKQFSSFGVTTGARPAYACQQPSASCKPHGCECM